MICQASAETADTLMCVDCFLRVAAPAEILGWTYRMSDRFCALEIQGASSYTSSVERASTRCSLGAKISQSET